VNYVPPSLSGEAYTCPHCAVYSLFQGTEYDTNEWGRGHTITLRECRCCFKLVLWLDDLLLYPDMHTAPPPNGDLSAAVQADYLEAASIVSRSPRGAAALLRLCIQNICKELGGAGKKVNDDIGKLVDNGLPVRIQQALDIVRVVGNNAVHPGELDIRDDKETAMRLFTLVNMVADVMISQPKAIAEMYESLPEGARQAIEKRDA
jgi:hypothetical protein